MLSFFPITFTVPNICKPLALDTRYREKREANWILWMLTSLHRRLCPRSNCPENIESSGDFLFEIDLQASLKLSFFGPFVRSNGVIAEIKDNLQWLGYVKSNLRHWDIKHGCDWGAKLLYHFQVWSLTKFYHVVFSQSRISVNRWVSNKCTIKVCVSCLWWCRGTSPPSVAHLMDGVLTSL